MIRLFRGLRIWCAGACLAIAFSVSALAAGTAVDPWQAEIDRLVAGDAAAPPPQHGVLFVGSSSIRLWQQVGEDFPGVPVVNRGFGGSRIEDSTRHAAELVTPYHPKLVVFYAGDNDINDGHSSEQVLTDFQAFVARVRRDDPTLPVAYIAIKPSVARVALWPQMRKANALIEAWAKTQRDVVFVDIATRMLDAQGKPRPELLLGDGLHMQRAGYAIWVEALTPVLARYGFKVRG